MLTFSYCDLSQYHKLNTSEHEQNWIHTDRSYNPFTSFVSVMVKLWLELQFYLINLVVTRERNPSVTVFSIIFEIRLTEIEQPFQTFE